MSSLPAKPTAPQGDAHTPALSPAATEAPVAAASAAEASTPDAAPEQANGDEGDSSDAGDKTVFDDSEHFTLAHPLASTWTMYADLPNSTRRATSSSWGQTMEKLADVDTVEAFMGLYNNIPTPTQLGQKMTFYLFRDGIQPAWEDKGNLGGGSWNAQFPREKSTPKIDEMWLNTLLAAIGETLDVPFPSGARPLESLDQAPPAVAGVALAARPNFYRLSIWTRAPTDAVKGAEDDIQRIGQRTYDVGLNFKVNALGFGADEKVASAYGSEVEFMSHEDAGRNKGRKGKVSV